jgi:hypothetical protein
MIHIVIGILGLSICVTFLVAFFAEVFSEFFK